MNKIESQRVSNDIFFGEAEVKDPEGMPWLLYTYESKVYASLADMRLRAKPGLVGYRFSSRKFFA